MGIHFAFDEEVNNAVLSWLRRQPKTFFFSQWNLEVGLMLDQIH